MTGVLPSQPMPDALRQHIADYLAERKPDYDGDIVVIFTANQRDAFVALLNSHASLKARIEEQGKQLETWKRAAHEAERAVEVLESNARVQAKLLADTGRRAEELEGALRAIMKATVEGRVCDDVAWFDSITTLHDFCDLVLNGPDDENRAVVEAKP